MMASEFGKVAVMFGGTSAEREVSLMSGRGVLAALQGQGIAAEAFDPAERPLAEIREYDRVFVILHGGHGENGDLQGALELMGVPYTGPGVLTSAVALDKLRTKLMWQAVGLPVPDYELLNAQTDFAAVERRLGLPMFVKPAREGSSIGVTKVKQPGELAAAYAAAAKYDSLVIAERAMLGGEYTVTILGDVALPIVKIEPATEFYDYDAKYFRDDTIYRCPSGLPPELEKKIQQQALEAFSVLNGRGWSRVDFLMDAAGQHYFLEVNTAPGMTSHSLAPIAARAAGMEYPAFVRRILELAALD